MFDHYEQSEPANEVFKAFVSAQLVLGRADKDGKNPHYRSRYATLTSVIEAVRPVFAEHGLCIMQHAGHSDGLVKLTTVIGHTSGQWLRSECSVPIGKRADSHALGSAISYLRRYTLASIACLVQDDDDGNQVSHVQRSRSPGNVTPLVTSESTFKVTALSVADLSDRIVDNEISVDELVAWCAAHNRGNPMEYPAHRQKMLLDWLDKGGNKTVQKWATEQALAGAGGEG